MKKFKRFHALLLAIIMVLMCFGTTTAFAAESTREELVSAGTISVENANANEYSVAPAALETVLHQTFNISGAHTGSTRTYNYDQISFICTFKDRNGNDLSDGTILAVRLYDATTGTKVNEWQGSNGVVMTQLFSIDKTHRYYFQYLVAYGTTNLSLDMLILTSA